jgi:hypothetical protein
VTDWKDISTFISSLSSLPRPWSTHYIALNFACHMVKWRLYTIVR